MKLVNERGQLFGRINVVDFVVGAAIVLGVSGVFLVHSGTLVTSGQEVQGETDIKVTVEIPNLKTFDKNLFVPGEQTAITIRNQPRGAVKIDSVVVNPIKMTLMGPGGQAVSVIDVSQPNDYDYQMILHDHAKITKDGYVAEGVKVKIGLPIELEGFKYRVFGKIVNVDKA